MADKDRFITDHGAELDRFRRELRTLQQKVEQQERTIADLTEDSRFRAAVIERATEGVCVCHDVAEFPGVKFTVWNQRMIDITGYTMEEINRIGWYQSLYPDSELQARARARMERMRIGEDLDSERWEITQASGEKRPISISTSVLTDKGGSVHVLGLMRDLSDAERLEIESNLARVDDLTGVRNRRGFLEIGQLLFSLARRQGQPITLGYFDVDDLKSVNDTNGHDEGDRLLAAIGTMLADKIRSSDVAGRLGGDEFAVVGLNLGAVDARAVFGSLQQRMQRLVSDKKWPTGVSVGVVTFTQEIPSLEEALQIADSVMYKSKAGKKGDVRFEA